MKRTIAFILALVLCLSFAACGKDKGKTEEKVIKLSPGDTAATDLAEFTLIDSQFTYYVSNVSSNYVAPMDEPNELFNASIGHCYVSLNFTITNNDRGGSISFAGSFSDWDPTWTVSYGGKEYPVKGFDLNDNGGSNSINLDYAAILNKDTGDVLKNHDTSNYLLHAGETVTLRTFGIIDIEPENLTDGFDLTVSVPNSKSEYEQFTFEIPGK